ncbi:hypothetical protein BAUCODRAFT_104864 [Baudoinia panamericana UAMH 10762]|uniref:Porphobilinogen deaminase n=1 Tax=Baudoinia panamericana (strain UAMH 10762) TaxID=717646 RepID=M2MMN9_BAUPA|nr:uncharacterized protein BAUCODRAFT_104864 [Baudoinia panamericana UAMH 10762]EMC97956.1 hypothetical protein BAUCODRAFT_104864 [Baudoinia panamericana UAMH 10762]
MAGLQDAPIVNETTIETSAPVSGQSSQKATFHVGTRASLLARVQTDEVVKALRAAWPDHLFEIHAMTTTGDKNQTTALHKFNEKALWTQELEVLLQNGELDFIVHSLKDMPTQLPVDLQLGAVTKRRDPRDALVIKPSLVGKCRSLADLPEGSVVGTSSLRRTAQLKRRYPQLRYADVRGNLGTRLAKLDNPESEYAAIIIAVAGLDRLGMGDRITSYLSSSHGGMLGAVGQGALGIESRRDDRRVEELLSRIGHERSTFATLTERSLMRTLEGGCSVPIGVETEWKTDELTDELLMRAVVISLDGDEVAETETRKRILSRQDAEDFGFEVARQLVAKGADKILEKIQLNRQIIHDQGDA